MSRTETAWNPFSANKRSAASWLRSLISGVLPSPSCGASPRRGVRIRAGRAASLLRGDEWGVNLSESGRLIEQPVALDAAHGIAYFGAPSWAGWRRLDGGMAPDPALKGFGFVALRLSGYPGQRVFLL